MNLAQANKLYVITMIYVLLRKIDKKNFYAVKQRKPKIGAKFKKIINPSKNLSFEKLFYS